MLGRNFLVPSERTVLCLVCGDVSSGLHYGIHTCESCKSFFKRSVQKQALSACHNGNNCAVTWENKAGCQACRFAKCLTAGMRMDAVRVDQTCGGRRCLPPPCPGLGTSPMEDAVKFVNNANVPVPPNMTTSSAVTKENLTNFSTAAVASTTLDDSERPASQPCEEFSQKLKCVPVESKMWSNSAQENEDVASPVIKMEITEEKINYRESTPSGRPDPVVCLVCGDVSSGLHYGIHTCESCKAFFKRSVHREKQGQVPGKCRRNIGNCPVMPQKKAGCQACRFTKCLAAGMKRDYVRVNQTPGRPQGKQGLPFDLSEKVSESQHESGSISIEELLRVVNSKTVPATSVVKEEPTDVDSVEETSITSLDSSSVQLDTQPSENYRASTPSGRPDPVVCLVCGDVSSGLHYGIHTCESCKAFFKRSVQREKQGQAPVKCRNIGNCPVTSQKKAGCQACRFAKCLAAGMKRDSVRVDQSLHGSISIEELLRVVNSKTVPATSVVKEEPTDVDSVEEASITSLDSSSVQLDTQPSEEYSQGFEYVFVKSDITEDSTQENGDLGCPTLKEVLLGGAIAPSQVAVLCLVCRDISSGLHYGIHTCESCKAFFKRSVRRENQGQAPSACRSSGDCPVTWQRKTGCQACRFAKCLAAGMRREAVRPDQTRGGRRSAPTSSSYDELVAKYRRLQDLQPYSAQEDPLALGS